MKQEKLIFCCTLILLCLFGLNVGAQGTYTVTKGTTPKVGDNISSVSNITMIYGGGSADSYTTAAASTSITGYSAYTVGKNNPTDASGSAYSVNFNTPVKGTFYVFKPTIDGTVNVAVGIAKSLGFYVIEDSVALEEFSGKVESTTAESFVTEAIPMRAGHTYYVFANKGKMKFFGFSFAAGATFGTGPTEVASIAALKALGSVPSAKLTLTDAKVTLVSGKNAYVQDATGGIMFYNMGSLIAGTSLTGTIYGAYSLYNGTPELQRGGRTVQNAFVAIASSAVTPLADSVKNIKSEANICKVVKISGVKIINGVPASSTNKKAYFFAVQGKDTVEVYDQCTFLDSTFVIPVYANSITGMLTIYKGVYEIYPMSVSDIDAPSYANPLELCVNGSVDGSENSFSGWTIDINSSCKWKTNSTTYKNFSGKFMEAWISGATLPDKYAYQIARNLPDGLYILSAAVNATYQTNASLAVKGVNLYMNGDSVACHTGNAAPEIFTVKKIMKSDTIKFGIDIASTDANWFAWDNVSLKYYGDSAQYEKDKAVAELAAAQKALTDEIDMAQAISNDATYTSDKTALNAAITTASASKESTDMTVLADALKTLQDAVGVFKISGACYNHPYSFTVVNGDMSQAKTVGWTSTMTKMQTSKSYSGGQFMESWVKTGGVADCEAYQTIANLPAGLYKLSAVVNTNASPTKGVYLFANDDSLSCTGSWTTHTLLYNMKSVGDIKLGLSIKSTNSGWVAFDAVTLTFYGDSAQYAADYDAIVNKPILDSLIIVAQGYDTNSISDDKSAFETAIATAQAAPATSSKTAIADLTAAINTYITSGAIPTEGNYFDMTGFIVNPKLETVGTGWSYTPPTTRANTSEVYESTFDMNQTLKGMPIGSYTLGLKAFHRPCAYSESALTTPIDDTWLYANNSMVSITSLYYLSSAATFTNNAGNYANSMEDANVIFNQGFYDNELKFVSDTSDIKIGLVNNNTTKANWTIFRDFTLKFYGISGMADELKTDIKDAEDFVADDTYKVGKEALKEVIAAVAPDTLSTNVKVLGTATKKLQSAVELFVSHNMYANALDSANVIIAANENKAVTEVVKNAIAKVEPTTVKEYIAAHDTLALALKSAVAVLAGNDLTSLIINPKGVEGTKGWTGNVVTNSGERFDGTSVAYFDKWNASSLDVSSNQTIYYLPAGKYELTVASRAAADITIRMYADTDTISIKAVGANGGDIWTAAKAKVDAGTATAADSAMYNVNNKTGFGWSYMTFDITLPSAKPLNIGVVGNVNNTWFGYTDWTLKLISTIDPVPVSVNSINREVVNDGNVYSISGTIVRKNAKSLEGLNKGIYIINNKKVVVK